MNINDTINYVEFPAADIEATKAFFKGFIYLTWQDCQVESAHGFKIRFHW